MSTDYIDAEVVGSTLAVRESAPPASPALFGTADPVEIVQNAVRVADALKGVIVAKKLVANIQGKEYPQVEAWLTLAAMLRLTTVCEWSRPVEGGWEARVYVRDASGATVGAAEAQCLSSERSKKSWEAYAIRSMAQTRATSKALRSVLGFIMVLAGYEATLSEEMPGDTSPPPAPPKAEPEKPKPTTAEVVAELEARWLAAGGSDLPVTFREAMEGLSVRGIREAVEALEAQAAQKPAEEAQRAPEPATAAKTATCVGPGGCGGPHTEPQHARFFSATRRAKLTDPERYALMAEVGAPPSATKCTGAQLDAVVAALEAKAGAA